MKLRQGQAAKRRPEYAQPGHAVLLIKEGAREHERIPDFRTAGQRFEVNGAEGNSRGAESGSDGNEHLVSPPQDCDAEHLALVAGLL